MSEESQKWIERLPGHRAEQKLLRLFKGKERPSQQQTDAVVRAALSPAQAPVRDYSSASQSDSGLGSSACGPLPPLLAALSTHTIVPWSVFASPRFVLDSEEALSAATEIISNSKTYLTMARHYSSSTRSSFSYTTQSQNISGLHRQVLQSLLQRLGERCRFPVAVLKALTALVVASPWEALDSTLLPLIYNRAEFCKDSSDPHIYSAVLTLFSAIASTGCFEIPFATVRLIFSLLDDTKESEDRVCGSLNFFATLLETNRIPSDELKAELLEKVLLQVFTNYMHKRSLSLQTRGRRVFELPLSAHFLYSRSHPLIFGIEQLTELYSLPYLKKVLRR